MVLEIHAFEAIYESLQAISEEQLNENKFFARVKRSTYEHYRIHAADIHKRFKTAVKR